MPDRVSQSDSVNKQEYGMETCQMVAKRATEEDHGDQPSKEIAQDRNVEFKTENNMRTKTRQRRGVERTRFNRILCGCCGMVPFFFLAIAR